MSRAEASAPLRGLTFDAGMLIALDRDDRVQWARLRAAWRRRALPVIPAPVVAQVWRSPRQVNLASAIDRCRVESVDLELAREAGRLSAAAGTADAVDAIVVASAARRGGAIATSDARDIARLAAHVAGVRVLRV